MTAGLPRAVVVALARYRQRWGLTLEQLAERTGLPSSDLARFEEGTAVPDAAAADALVTALQLDDLTTVALRAAAEGRVAEARVRPRAAGGRYDGWDDRPAIRLTTIGRRSGRPHEHECTFFVVDGDRLFLLDPDGGLGGWYRDVAANEGVSVRAGGGPIRTGRAVTLPVGNADAERARALATRKYPDARDAVGAAAVAVLETFEVG